MGVKQSFQFLQQIGIKHVSEVPWSSVTEADYTLQQWHNACLIHLHDGPPTAKSQCKLPVRMPSGALNMNGVHAAAAALAGAREPLKAPPEKIAAAKTAIRGLYKQLGQKPPPSMMQFDSVSEFLEHHGVKGQRWGIRNPRNRVNISRDAARAARLRKKKPSQLTNKQLKELNDRMNLEKNFRNLNPGSFVSGKHFVEALIATATLGATAYNLLHSPAGQAAVSVGKKLVKTKA